MSHLIYSSEFYVCSTVEPCLKEILQQERKLHDFYHAHTLLLEMNHFG